MRTVRWALSGLTLSTLVIGLLNACQGPSVYGLVCGKGELRSGNKCLPVYAVRSNSVGYAPAADKRAAFVADSADFELRNAKTDKVVLKGTGAGPTKWKDTGEDLYVADFSTVTEEGRYYISVEGGRSAEFEIGTKAIDEALNVSMLGIYGQRCGEDVSFAHAEGNYVHKACHLEPASLEKVGGGEKEDHFGWHDAGDYGKYTVNGAFALAFYLKAFAHFPGVLQDHEFEIPERGGDVPDILDESRTELVWLLKVQLKDGSFSHKVTAYGFEGMIMPEDDHSERAFTPAGTPATGDAVAALALGARLYKDYDAEFAATCLAAAEKGYAYLVSQAAEVTPDLTGFGTGAYLSGDGDEDERAWAAAELFATTGDEAYLPELEAAVLNKGVAPFFDWGGVWNMALETYLRAEHPGRDPAVVSAVANAFLLTANAILTQTDRDPYGRGNTVYTWGGNGGVARIAYILVAANFIEPKPEYYSAVQAQLDYLFGRNPYGRSFVTGVGHLPPMAPHHRPSVADLNSAPWPGLLVGGPHGKMFDQETAPAPGSASYVLPALTWEDRADDYMHNEIAINWNGPLTYALTAALGMSTDGPGCDCLDPGEPNGVGGAGGAGGAAGAAGGAN